MAHEAALEFIRGNPRGVMATYRRDGQAQLSPVIAAVDAEDRVVISTRKGEREGEESLTGTQVRKVL